MTTIKWHQKHLLGIEHLSAAEISIIFEQAAHFKEILKKPVPKEMVLKGKTVVHLFCEPSTRTKTSFELAAKRVGADVVNIAISSSSFVKGETLRDTVRNIEAMRAEFIVVRHSCAGAAHLLTKWTDLQIINAGDGAHEHPTQALLDLFTIKEKLGKVSGKNVTIIGDITHSRVAYSNILGLKKLGAKITICGPKTLIPAKIEDLGIKIDYDLKSAIADADVINVLRIQLERQDEAFFPSIREYAHKFGINNQLLNKHAKKGVLIMHPGPINRNVELDHDVADGKHSLILEQVTNGVAIRMALLFLLNQWEQKP